MKTFVDILSEGKRKRIVRGKEIIKGYTKEDLLKIDPSDAASIIIDHLKKTFKPLKHGKVSKNVEEIVIEYLSGGWISNPTDYLEMRYGVDESYSDRLVKELIKFSFLQD